MWGREGGRRRKSSKHIYLHPLHLRGTVVYLYQEGYILFGGLFFDWMERFFSFLEYRQILWAGMDRRDTEAEGEGGRVSTCLGRQKSR